MSDLQDFTERNAYNKGVKDGRLLALDKVEAENKSLRASRDNLLDACQAMREIPIWTEKIESVVSEAEVLKNKEDGIIF